MPHVHKMLKWLELAGMMMVALIFVFPFVWMFLTSFKSLQEVIQHDLHLDGKSGQLAVQGQV